MGIPIGFILTHTHDDNMYEEISHVIEKSPEFNSNNETSPQVGDWQGRVDLSSCLRCKLCGAFSSPYDRMFENGWRCMIFLFSI
jgi:hypothetical protein